MMPSETARRRVAGLTMSRIRLLSEMNNRVSIVSHIFPGQTHGFQGRTWQPKRLECKTSRRTAKCKVPFRRSTGRAQQDRWRSPQGKVFPSIFRSCVYNSLLRRHFQQFIWNVTCNKIILIQLKYMHTIGIAVRLVGELEIIISFLFTHSTSTCSTVAANRN